jgi:hypothetical protein
VSDLALKAVMSRRRKKAPGSPLLDLLVDSLAQDPTQDRSSDAAALRAYGELALVQVPLRGVFPPQDEELDDAIDEIATQFLGFGKASHAFAEALTLLNPIQRNEVDEAVTALRIVSDKAYFYAGVAFGATLVNFGGLGAMLACRSDAG